jgi:hypothetical protein
MSRSTIRRGIVAAVAVVAGATLAPAAATAAPYQALFTTRTMCEQVGQAGVQAERWAGYLCSQRIVNGTTMWALYVHR